MNLVGVLVVLAVIGVVAAVVVGAVRGEMPEPTTSLAPSGLPDGDLTPQDVRDVRFSLGFRGYRMDEVDEVLERLTAELVRRDAELASRNVQLADLLRRTGGMDPGVPGERPSGHGGSDQRALAQATRDERVPAPAGGADRDAAEQDAAERAAADRAAAEPSGSQPAGSEPNGNGQAGNGVGGAHGRHVAEAAADREAPPAHPGRHEAPVDPRPAADVGQPVPGGARGSDAEAS